MCIYTEMWPLCTTKQRGIKWPEMPSFTDKIFLA